MSMKYRLFNIIVLSLSAFISTFSLAASQAKPIVCTQKYALCTSAPCIPDPRHPDYAICSCVVEKGDSVGYKTCEKRIPKPGSFKTTQIISTFSFAQFKTKKSMTCMKGTAWTDCVDAPCTINPMDPSKAICSCKINHTQAFFTFGGDCDTSTCTTGFWSGATTTAGASLRNSLIGKLKLPQNAWSNTACPMTIKNN